MIEQERTEFDAVLEAVIDSLPDEARAHLNEVPVIVDDEPSREIRLELGEDPADIKAGPSDLCGLHWGIPLSERAMLDGAPGIDKICLFRGPILRLSGGSKREQRRQIRITLLHEIGHLFGLTEERLEDLGYE